ncbi:MAG: hypothetical protein Q8867_10625 [Bacteroidota bacterium]|nr:hypothetical protein [Bacteroidota bacterium]
MKKQLFFLALTVIMLASFSSCKKDKNDDSSSSQVTAAKITTLGVVYSDGVERYAITYDSLNRVKKIDDYWNDTLVNTMKYDFSVAGKLTYVSGTDTTLYDLNANNMVTKEYWGNGEYAEYSYDNNGYLVKIVEHWGGADHLKMVAEIKDGNIMKHTTYDDDGVTVKKIKEFIYTNGDNATGIQQACMVDNNTKPLGNLFGKPSKKLVDYLNYWDPRVTPNVVNRTTIAYEFDAKNRPTKITRSGDGWQEVYTYGYDSKK